MSRIMVLDSIMGSGKTKFMMEEINRNVWVDPDVKYLYVSPYLKEVGDPSYSDRDKEKQEKERKGRIGIECPAANFQQPDAQGHRKRDHLKELLAGGHNVAMTHKLFEFIDDETVQIIGEQNYHVIIDEALAVIQPYTSITKADLGILSVMTIVNEDSSVSWVGTTEGARYSDIKKLCDEGRLFHHLGKFFIWELPVSLLSKAKSVTILTYLFESSIMCAWFKKHGVLVGSLDPVALGLRSEADILAEAVGLIDIDESPYIHKLGRRAFTKTGYNKLSDEELKKIQGEVKKMVERYVRTPSKNLIWTTFKDFEVKLRAKGYSRSFVACNTRATNDYGDREVGIYLMNRYPHAFLQSFLRESGVSIDPDLFALSELIQWVWRLRIRNGQSIRLFIPSLRMRKLLKEWLKGERVEELSKAA